jgi:hypothetical protein
MIRPYKDDQHYEIFSQFLVQHGWPMIPRNMLSPTGFVSYHLDIPLCFIFVYETVGSAWGIMEWLVVDPYTVKEDRSRAINECIAAAKAFANERGLTLFSSVNNDKLKSRYEEAGFQRTDEGMTNFIYGGQ